MLVWRASLYIVHRSIGSCFPKFVSKRGGGRKHLKNVLQICKSWIEDLRPVWRLKSLQQPSELSASKTRKNHQTSSSGYSSENCFLRVIPTNWYSIYTVWHFIYISGSLANIYHDIIWYYDILSGKRIWHTSFLAFYLISSEILCWSRSGGDHFDPEVAVRVWRVPLWSRACSWGPAEEGRGRGGGGRPADMKSWWLVKKGQTCCFWSCRGRARCPMTLAWNWIDLLSVGLSLSSKLGTLPYFSKKTNTLIFNCRILQIVTVDLRYQLLTYRIKSFTAAAPT